MLGALACGCELAPALAATGLNDDAATAALPQISMPIAALASTDDGASGAAVGNPLWGIPLHALSATRERPLFSPSRRPPAPPVVAVAPPPPPPSKPAPPATPPLTLVGTVLGGSEGVGVFIEQGTKDIIRLRVGEGRGGWTLSSLQARAAILDQGERQATLALSPRDSAVQLTASVSPPKAVVPSRPAAQPAVQAPATPPPGKWVDGDGRVISPPPLRAATRNTPQGRWTDGDGHPASPPAARATVTAPSRASGSWVDGDGQVITPPPTQVRQIAQP